MNKEEFNYMKKCLVDSIDTLNRVKNIHEIYYLKGVINTLQDILYKYSEDPAIKELNKSIYHVL